MSLDCRSYWSRRDHAGTIQRRARTTQASDVRKLSNDDRFKVLFVIGADTDKTVRIGNHDFLRIGEGTGDGGWTKDTKA